MTAERNKSQKIVRKTQKKNQENINFLEIVYSVCLAYNDVTSQDDKKIYERRTSWRH